MICALYCVCRRRPAEVLQLMALTLIIRRRWRFSRFSSANILYCRCVANQCVSVCVCTFFILLLLFFLHNFIKSNIFVLCGHHTSLDRLVGRSCLVCNTFTTMRRPLPKTKSIRRRRRILYPVSSITKNTNNQATDLRRRRRRWRCVCSLLLLAYSKNTHLYEPLNARSLRCMPSKLTSKRSHVRLFAFMSVGRSVCLSVRPSVYSSDQPSVRCLLPLPVVFVVICCCVLV